MVFLLPAMLYAQPSWTWSEGVVGGSDQRGMSIATDASGNSLSTGFFKGSPDFDANSLTSSGNDDAYVTKYDSNGNGIWAVKIAGTGEQRGFGITTDAAGNSYVCGSMESSTTFYGSSNIVLNAAGNKDAFIAKYNSAGQVLWAKHVACSNADEALSVCTNGTNVFVTGYFSGTATFGALTPLTSSGGEDVFIAAYSCANGTEQWALKGGSSGNDRGDGIAVDASGVYVSGFYTNATITFQNQVGSLASIGGTDIFVVKYNLTGTTGLWQRRAGSSANDEGNCLTIGGNAVYVGGFFDNTMNLYNSGVTVVATITTANNHDGCIIKYDATTGNYGWAVSENGQGDDHVYEISCSPFGNVYATGSWNGTLPFGSGPAVTSSSEDVFVSTYNSAGVFVSGLRATGTDDEIGYGISASYPNAVYVTGYFKSNNTTFGATPSLSASSEDIFIAKILCGVTVSNAGIDQTVCASTATLNGNTPSSGSGLWTLISGAGNITTPSSQNSGVTALGIGANVFRWTITNGGCVSFDEVTITRDASPTTAAAGGDQTLCSPNATLAGNVPAVGTGIWTLISGTGTITTPGAANSGVTLLGVGPNVFQWTITNGVCPSSTDQVTITQHAVPTTANAGADQTLCSSTVTLSGNTPAIGIGTWTLVSGNGTITTPSSPSSNITGLGIGPNVFQWTITNGTCPSSSDQVTITRDANPTTANAGSNQTLCSSTAFLNAINPTVGTGFWTLVTGTGTIVTPTSDNTTVNSLGVGANVFQWTVSNGTCPSSTDQVTITVDPFPTTANAGANQNVCASTATLNGNVPTTGTGTWTLISGSGTITTPNSASSGITGLAVGNNVFQWTISSGTCPSSSDQVTITRDANPSTAFAGSNQTLCSSTAFLNAINPTVGTGLWTLVTGTGTIVTPNSDNTTVNSLGVGANVFQWTVSNGTCPSSTDQVTITVDAMPTTSVAGVDQTICSSSATLNGNVPTIGTGSWTLVSGTGTVSNPSLENSGVTGLGVGNNVFEWTISNGTCPSSSDQVTITRDAAPNTAAAGSDQTLCNSSAFLNANNVITGTGLWTLVSGIGTITNPTNENTTVNSLGVGVNVFQWTISNGVCPSSSDQVTITVDSVPTISVAGADQTICSSNATLNGNAAVSGSGMWTLISGSGTIANPASENSAVTALGVGNNIFEWTISNGTCPSSNDQVTITVDAMPSTSVAGSDQTLCSASAFLNANNPATGTGVWTLVTGSGNIVSPASDNTSVNSLGIGNNIFQWTISNGTCPSSTDQVTITVDENPTTADAGSDLTICSSTQQLNGNTPLVGTGLWSVIAGTGVITNPTLPTSNVTGIPVGVNIFQWTTSNGVCPSSNDLVIFVVDPTATIPNAGVDHSRCSPTDTLNGNTPVIGSGLWTLISGSGVIANPNSPVTPVTQLGVGVNEFVWTTSNGTCPSLADTVVITRHDFPSQATAGSDVNSCLPLDTLFGNTPVIGDGVWSVIGGGATLSNALSPECEVNNLSVGQNIFVWTITNGSCASNTDTVVITYNQLPSLANAGSDLFACGEQISLQAQAPSLGTGFWQSINGSPAIPDSTNANAILPTLSAGTWNYQWTTQNGFCISEPDTVSITVYSPPTVALAGPDIVGYNTSFQLAANPIDTGLGTWSFVQGSGTFDDIHDPFTRVSNLSPGVNILRWRSSNGTCPENSDDMRIEILQLIVPSGFSPNGDGVNEYFEVTGLDEFESPAFEVFNRWGNQVYVSQHYENNWNGTGMNGEQLPDDIYYYVLKADEAKVFTGFIAIKRTTL